MLKNNITRPCWPVLCLLSFLGFTGCSSPTTSKDGPPLHTSTINFNSIPNAQPRALPRSRYGNPRSYVVRGERYRILKTARNYDKRGIASWYGKKFHGRLTSSRETYNMFAMTGASRTLPIPSFVRVTNLENGHSVIVKINDRGPFVDNRIVDLSYAAAEKLGYEAFVDFDDGEDDEDLEDEITEPWTCTCRKTMLLQYEAVMAAQEELDRIARPMGGYADGWGTFGNVEREDDETSV